MVKVFRAIVKYSLKKIPKCWIPHRRHTYVDLASRVQQEDLQCGSFFLTLGSHAKDQPLPQGSHTLWKDGEIVRTDQSKPEGGCLGLRGHLVVSLLYVGPAPGIVFYNFGPVIVIGAWSAGVNTEINGCTSSKSFTSIVIDLSIFEVLLWNGLVAPIIARYCAGEVPFSKCLVIPCGVLAASIKHQDILFW